MMERTVILDGFPPDALADEFFDQTGGASGPCLERGPKPKPLLVFDRRHRHAHGAIAGVLVVKNNN